jgi:hypothetical protein
MKRIAGPLLWLLLSLALGVVLGELNFRFFQRAVPPAAMGQVSLGWVHTTCIFYGLGVGVILFFWGMLATGLARLFAGKRRS